MKTDPVKPLLWLFVLSLCAMALFRLYFYFHFLPSNADPVSLQDLLAMLFFGLRLDMSALGYLFLPPLLGLLIGAFWPKLPCSTIFRYYFFGVLLFLIAVLFGDMAYYSFFGEHMTLMIFGIFDDDTRALWAIAQKNYNLTALLIGALLTALLLWLGLGRLFRAPLKPAKGRYLAMVALLIILDLLAIRGSFGKYPVYRWSEDVVADRYANQVAKSPFYAFVRAVKQYTKSKSGHADYAKRVGWHGTTATAYAAVAERPCPKADLACLRRVTPPNPAAKRLRPHVVVIMAESFGLPILRYQSPDFDIMGRLKPHFEEDILFTRFISTANGTIASMEPTLLNLTALPGSTPYAQGPCQTRTFPTAAASVYQKAGYETTFLYGGDLSWRNVGNFFAKQGFEHVEGKAKIGASLRLGPKDYHDWGVYDQFLYRYILHKLQRAEKPQFIFVMTTNNHPPYELIKGYRSRIKALPESLKNHLHCDTTLALKRFRDYGYALDSLGGFLSDLKASPLAQKTVIAVTADNNTVEGIMRYDNFLETSKKIPFYLYLPASLRPAQIDTTVPGSHKDLFATLYRLTLSQTPYYSVGRDLLDPKTLHCGFNISGIILSPDGAFENGKARTPLQKRCQEYYRAAVAVSADIAQRVRKGEFGYNTP